MAMNDISEDFETEICYAFNEAICQAVDAGKKESLEVTAFILSRPAVRAILAKAERGEFVNG